MVFWCLVVRGALWLVGSLLMLGGLLCGVCWLLPLWGCQCGSQMACSGGGCTVFRWCGGCGLLCTCLASPGGRGCVRGVANGLLLVCDMVGVSRYGLSWAPGVRLRCFSPLRDVGCGVAGHAGFGSVSAAVVWVLLVCCGVWFGVFLQGSVAV